MGVKIGLQATRCVQQRDSSRIDRSERRVSDVVKQARIARREEGAALRDFQEEEEGLLYGPDIADLRCVSRPMRRRPDHILTGPTDHLTTPRFVWSRLIGAY